MGYYIPNNSKVWMKEATYAKQPSSLKDVPEDKALICQVDNGLFVANALIYSEEELKVFTDNDDRRGKEWWFVNKDVAHKLSLYSLNPRL